MDKDGLQYRFSGYQLPLIKLDESGYNYVLLGVHPYFYNQPQEWQKAAYIGSQPLIGTFNGNNASNPASTSTSTSGSDEDAASYVNNLCPIL